MMSMVTCAKQWQSAHVDVAHQVWVVHTSRWVFSNLVVNDEIIAWVIQSMKLMPEKRRTGMWFTTRFENTHLDVCTTHTWCATSMWADCHCFAHVTIDIMTCLVHFVPSYVLPSCIRYFPPITSMVLLASFDVTQCTRHLCDAHVHMAPCAPHTCLALFRHKFHCLNHPGYYLIVHYQI